MQASTPSSDGGLRDELRSDAATLSTTAKDRLHGEIDARKGAAVSQTRTLSSALDKAAGELEQSPDWLKSAFRQGAQTIQRLAESIEHKDSRQLTSDAQRFARENPGTFLAGCAVAGFAAARVLKAGVEDVPGSAAQTSQGSIGQSGSAQAYDPYGAQQASTSGTAFTGMESAGGAAAELQGGVV
jgi:hypothetical protein